jgi:hypothetical protein
MKYSRPTGVGCNRGITQAKRMKKQLVKSANSWFPNQNGFGPETIVTTESLGYTKLTMFLVPPLKFFISIYNFSNKGHEHRLNMELDLQSLFSLYKHSCTHWLGPHNPSAPSRRMWAHIRGRYWSVKIDDISL